MRDRNNPSSKRSVNAARVARVEAGLAVTRRDTRLPEPRPATPGDPSSDEVAAYILDMSLVLRNSANEAGLVFLAYLLDMAAEEADARRRHLDVDLPEARNDVA